MSYEEISCKEVSAHKDYKCEWCNECIPQGSKHVYRAYKFYGDFNAGRMHLECFKAMEDSDYDLLADGWSPGDIERGVPVR